MINTDFWKNKRVFLTGHTGFKGCWATLMMEHMGAKVTGFSLPPESPSLFLSVESDLAVDSHYGDIVHGAELRRVMQQAEPEIVIHMAAQPLVRRSYDEPVLTFAVNTLGTAHLLEAVRHTPGIKVVLAIVTDKCYKDQRWYWGYREFDALGGHDPYSASKAAAELVVDSYRNSFFSMADSPVVASARAGNVIGGGDWAVDRLIPDMVRAYSEGRTVHLRRPDAVRPWQHVLDALCGYMTLIQHCWDSREFGEPWNFGPMAGDNRTVEWVVRCFTEYWGAGEWSVDAGTHPHETGLLLLDCAKALHRLGWASAVELDTALKWTAEWYKERDAGEACRTQITRFLSMIKDA